MTTLQSPEIPAYEPDSKDSDNPESFSYSAHDEAAAANKALFKFLLNVTRRQPDAETNHTAAPADLAEMQRLVAIYDQVAPRLPIDRK